jgi:hypothetical protein
MMELDIINLFGFTPKDGIRDNILNFGVRILYKITKVACLENWNKVFANGFQQ